MSQTRQARVRAFSRDYPSGHRLPPHAHTAAQLVFASAGVMTVQTPDGAWTVPPHRAVWVPKRVKHSIRMFGAVAMRTLYLPAEMLPRDMPERCAVLEVSPLLREIVLVAVSRGGLRRGVRADENLLRVLLDELRPLAGAGAPFLPVPRDPRALRVARRLEHDPSEPAPLGSLLRGSGASRRTIERRFRAETGMSLGAWRREVRLARALELLAAGESVTTTALECGYASLSAFVAAFKHAFGRTPGRYFRDGEAPAAGSRAG
jgi:AraC-like DNA-binding protein